MGLSENSVRLDPVVYHHLHPIFRHIHVIIHDGNPYESILIRIASPRRRNQHGPVCWNRFRNRFRNQSCIYPISFSERNEHLCYIFVRNWRCKTLRPISDEGINVRNLPRQCSTSRNQVFFVWRRHLQAMAHVVKCKESLQKFQKGGWTPQPTALSQPTKRQAKTPKCFKGRWTSLPLLPTAITIPAAATDYYYYCYYYYSYSYS